MKKIILKGTKEKDLENELQMRKERLKAKKRDRQEDALCKMARKTECKISFQRKIIVFSLFSLFGTNAYILIIVAVQIVVFHCHCHFFLNLFNNELQQLFVFICLFRFLFFCFCFFLRIFCCCCFCRCSFYTSTISSSNINSE